MNLVDGFLRSVQRFPDRPALEVNGESFTYRSLHARAVSIAAALEEALPADQANAIVGILAHRSLAAYSSVLGVLISGKTYLPLNPKFPTERLRSILDISGCAAVLVGSECEDLVEPLLGGSPVRTIGVSDLTDAVRSAPDSPNPEGPAYLLFTSGSTGVPKGVPVSHLSSTSYVQYVSRHIAANENDRFSQTFDLSFDLSVHDMFVCWTSGGCLCSVPENVVMAPAKFIRDQRLSCWFSVPSVGMFMSRMKMLKDNAFPSLRSSLFCGEALSGDLAARWQRAAPNSVVENFYGPTEATIAITHYTWDAEKSPAECINGIVPIGSVFDGHEARIVDDQYRVVPEGNPGELLLSGPQVVAGYFRNEERTRQAFRSMEDSGTDHWYCTGDVASVDERGCLSYLGRKDDQVQILGHRAELAEIDGVLRSVSGNPAAMVAPWPVEDGRALGVVGFVVSDGNLDTKALIAGMQERVPAYMVPGEIYSVDALPLNANGKTDRKALRAWLEDGTIGN